MSKSGYQSGNSRIDAPRSSPHPPLHAFLGLVSLLYGFYQERFKERSLFSSSSRFLNQPGVYTCGRLILEVFRNLFQLDVDNRCLCNFLFTFHPRRIPYPLKLPPRFLQDADVRVSRPPSSPTVFLAECFVTVEFAYDCGFADPCTSCSCPLDAIYPISTL